MLYHGNLMLIPAGFATKFVRHRRFDEARARKR